MQKLSVKFFLNACLLFIIFISSSLIGLAMIVDYHEQKGRCAILSLAPSGAGPMSCLVSWEDDKPWVPAVRELMSPGDLVVYGLVIKLPGVPMILFICLVSLMLFNFNLEKMKNIALSWVPFGRRR